MRSNRAMAIAAGCVLAAAAVGGLAWTVGRSLRVDPAPLRAAVEQYSARTGRAGVTVVRDSVWDDCAIVTVSTPDGEGANVAMKRSAAGWVTGRSSEEDSRSVRVVFDQDDIDSEQECLGVADSTGDVNNGALGAGNG